MANVKRRGGRGGGGGGGLRRGRVAYISLQW